MDKNRETALKILIEVEKQEAYSNLILNKYLEGHEELNKPFIRELVYGVLRQKKLLDYYISHFLTKSLSSLKKPELNILRMGIYQIKYMDSVPEYAACNESVVLGKKWAKGRDGLINVIMRKYIKDKDNIPEPESWEIRFSIENWIIQLLKKAYGSEETLKILTSLNKIPKLTIRINVNKTTRDKLKEILLSKGFQVEDNPYTPRGLWVKGGNLTGLDEYREGLFSIQDTASILVSDMLNPDENSRVLDLCAAPGGKTFATAELMHNKGEITAVDKYSHKIAIMEREIKRLGIKNVKLLVDDSQVHINKYENKFDCVLADVPCSGLGVMGNKPEMKYKEEEDFSHLIRIQREILINGATYVKKGGILIYSTCTVNPWENHVQTESFLVENDDFELLEEKQYLPYMDMDGFFICKMRRKDK